MSSLCSKLLQLPKGHHNNEVFDILIDHFNHTNQPYNDLLECLSTLTESTHNNGYRIHCVIQSFLQWINQLNKNLPVPNLDQNILEKLILKQLPIEFMKDFCKIIQISQNHLIILIRNLLNDSMDSPAYKRSLNIIVEFNYQLEFTPNEILLPLILFANTSPVFVGLTEYWTLVPLFLSPLVYCLQHLTQKLLDSMFISLS